MSVVFADSSALVKLYVDERGSAAVRRRERTAGFVVSALARVEVPAALWRKARSREIAHADARMLTAAFEYDWYGGNGEPSRFAAVAAAGAVIADAARLCESHDMRAFDAVQLASALALAADDPVVLASFDARLNAAAAAEGLAVMPTR